MQVIEVQFEALEKELARVGDPDPATQRQAMQGHWSMLQDHLRSLRQLPGVDARMCVDWMLLDQGVMGDVAIGRGALDCPLTGHGLDVGRWASPVGMAPAVYWQQMQQHMGKARARLAAISAATDPAQRQALLREHYETLYRDVQTMRGMGWMWASADSPPLPAADSRGARLVSRYCGQCHAPPPASLHTSSDWTEVLKRMRAHLGEQGASKDSGVLVPNPAEFEQISEHLSGHARAKP
jgi:hypothetical protein